MESKPFICIIKNFLLKDSGSTVCQFVSPHYTVHLSSTWDETKVAEGHRELAQHDLLPCLYEIEGDGLHCDGHDVLYRLLWQWAAAASTNTQKSAITEIKQGRQGSALHIHHYSSLGETHPSFIAQLAMEHFLCFLFIFIFFPGKCTCIYSICPRDCTINSCASC